MKGDRKCQGVDSHSNDRISLTRRCTVHPTAIKWAQWSPEYVSYSTASTSRLWGGWVFSILCFLTCNNGERVVGASCRARIDVVPKRCVPIASNRSLLRSFSCFALSEEPWHNYNWSVIQLKIFNRKKSNSKSTLTFFRQLSHSAGPFSS